LDREEPRRVAEAVRQMGLKHVVVTSVDRDDLEDGGAFIFAETIQAIRELHRGCVVEVLIPDFQGDEAALRTVLDAGPDILNHNIETVPRLFPVARGGGDYRRSLDLLSNSRRISADTVTKTGMMLGLGEREAEVLQVMEDLVERQVNILTLGQYLRPTSWHLPVDRYYHPDEFRRWGETGMRLGFDHVESGPLVRSSYLADRQFAQLRTNTGKAQQAYNQAGVRVS
jgi:lipoic acid synthetase